MTSEQRPSHEGRNGTRYPWASLTVAARIRASPSSPAEASLAASALPDPAPSARVVVADDRPIVRAGIEALLAASSAVSVVETCSLQDVNEHVARTRPDVVVLALSAGHPEALEAAARLKSDDVARVLLLVDRMTAAELRDAVVAGVDGILVTTAHADELPRAAAATARGERVISPEVAMDLVGSRRGNSRTGSDLTPRELEVLPLLAEGLTNHAIAEQLSLSPRTVKTHVQNLLAKLGVADRTGAVARAFRLGLIR